MAFASRVRFGALALVLAGGCSGEPPVPPPERIILIVVDTLRADHLSPYGSKAKTPHIQGLADRGQVFDRAYGSFHQTTMSMAALFTGHVPSLETGDVDETLAWNGRTWCGMHRFAKDPNDEACIPASLPSLAESLREAGYWTVGIVTNTLLFQPLGYERGFDEWIEVGRLGTSASVASYQANPPGARGAKNANRVAKRLLDQRPTDRFFLYIHYMDAHDYSATGVPYRRGVRRSDRAVGSLLAILRERGLLEGTTLWLVSDHGERLEESHFTPGGPLHYGNPSFEEVLHVPLIVSPAPPSPTSDALVRSDDVYRMILASAGLESEDPGDLEEGELFVSEQWYQTYRKGRFKSYRRRGEDHVSLVDLESDPSERHDVADRHPDIVNQHERRMRELSTHLRSRLPAPEGLDRDDRQRLKALGYLDSGAPAPSPR